MDPPPPYPNMNPNIHPHYYNTTTYQQPNNQIVYTQLDPIAYPPNPVPIVNHIDPFGSTSAIPLNVDSSHILLNQQPLMEHQSIQSLEPEMSNQQMIRYGIRITR